MSPTRLKVLHCITSLHGDGAQRMLLRLVSSMNRERFDNRVVALTNEHGLRPEFEREGIPVGTLGLARGLSTLRGPEALAREIRAFAPDVVQGWMYHANLLATAGVVRARSPARLAWNIRCSLYDFSKCKPLTRVVVGFGKRAAGRADAIIYTHSESAQQHERFGYPREKSVVIGNGFDLELFAPAAEQRSALREALGLGADTLLVGTVARYNPAKDYPNLLRAASRVVEHNPKVHFVLVGRDVDPWNRDLTTLCASLGIQRNVHLLGPRNDVPRLMPAFDVYCSPSYTEGFPNVIAEAMACGVPCVVTNVGTSAQLVDGMGVIVERANSKQLAAGLINMLSMSPEARELIGRAGRQRIVEEHAIQPVVGRYETLYSSLANGTASESVSMVTVPA